MIVGKGKGTGTTSTSSEFKSTVPVLKGAAMRLLNGRLNLSAVVNPSNRGSLLIAKENLLRWFESEQALVWSKEVSLIHERSKTTAQEPHRGAFERLISGNY